MEIKKLLQNKKFQKEIKKTSEWQTLGKEMTAYFGKNCFWLPWKFEMNKIYEKFKEIQKLGKKDFKYFLGMLKK